MPSPNKSIIEPDNNPTNNQILNDLLNSSLFSYLKKDTATKLALSTALITVGSMVVKLVSYIRLKGFLSVYSISIDSVNYTVNIGVLGFFINACVFVGLAVASAFIYLLIELTLNKCINFLYLAGVIIYIEVINVLLIVLLTSTKLFSINKFGWIVFLAFLSLLELMSSIIFKIKEKRNVKNTEKKPKSNYSLHPILDLILSSVVLIFFFYSASAYIGGIYQARQLKTYRMINDSYAIVYQDNEHYWLVSATVDKEKLILNTSKQKVIDIKGVETIQKDYVTVTIQY